MNGQGQPGIASDDKNIKFLIKFDICFVTEHAWMTLADLDRHRLGPDRSIKIFDFELP